MWGLIDVRPGERRLLGLSFAALLGITAAHTLVETARDALFLARLPASRLPWMYLAIAALGLVLARLRRAGPRTKAARGVAMGLVAAAVADVGFWILAAWPRPELLYALYVYSGMFASWVVVEFWMVLGALFDVSQAKRLFGLIGAGSVTGAVAGSAIARGLTGMLDARHLLVGASVVLVATALGPVRALSVEPQEDPGRARPAKTANRPSLRADAILVARDPYLSRILGIALASTIALTLGDFLFKAAVAREVPADRLGAYFATVGLVLNAASLVVQLGGVSWALRALGVHRALLLLPALLALGGTGLAAGGGLAAALVLKGADGTLRHSLHRTGTELLFVPVVDAKRARAKPLVDLIGQRGGQALASIAILVVVAVRAPAWILAAGVVALALVWIGVTVTIRRHYLDVFRATVRQGKVDYDGDLPALDLGALETLFFALNSSKDAEVMGALELLAAQGKRRLIPALVLYHPSSPVVLRALELFVAEGRTDFLPIAERLVATHPDGEVRAAALRAWTAVAADETFVRQRLGDEDAEVRATALVSAMARGWLSAEEGDRALDDLVSQGTPAVHAALARAIAADPSPRFERTLLALAATTDDRVLADTAVAMGRVGSESFFPVLARIITRREPGSAARDALAAIGEPAFEFLVERLADPQTDEEIRNAIPRALGAFEPERAAPVLLEHLVGDLEGVIRFRILRELGKLRRQDRELALDATRLSSAAEHALRSALEMCALRVAIDAPEAPRTPGRDLVVTLLRDKESFAIARCFRILGLMHPREDFERIHRALVKKNKTARASSRELVENVVKPPLRAPLLALIDDLPDADRVSRAAPWFSAEPMTYADAVRKLVGRGGETTTITAFYAREIGVTGRSEPPPALHAGPVAQRPVSMEGADQP